MFCAKKPSTKCQQKCSFENFEKNFKKSIDLFLSRWYIMSTLKEKSFFLQGKKQN